MIPLILNLSNMSQEWIHTDQPSCITTVKYPDGEIKEIDHYYGHIMIDDSLTAFEKKIERKIGT